MLEVMRDYFGLSTEHMRAQIQGMRNEVDEILLKKGINYEDLKSALVPDRKRIELALVFDSTIIDSSLYGNEVFKRVIPLFDKRSTHSILVGDYLGRPNQAESLFRAFSEAVEARKPINFRHPTQFFIVYINNLTETMVRQFDHGLSSYPAYVGFADMTFASRFKLYLSTMLPSLGIKHRSIVIQPHEPDRPDDEDINMSGFPFEANGYECKSLRSDIQGVLLSYKIERPIVPGFEADTELALNAISDTPMALRDFDIELDDAKLAYLKGHNPGSIERAGLGDISSEQLADIIREKMAENYIYNLSVDEVHDVAKFNIIIELSSTQTRIRTRFLAAMEYQPKARKLRIITFY